MCQIMKYNECGGMKSPAPLPFMFKLTSDFCADRCRTITLRFSPEAEFALSHDAQPLMINCEQLRREEREPSPCLRSSRPIERRRAIIAGFAAASLCEPSLQVDFYIMQNSDAPVILADRAGCGRRTQKWNSQNVTSVPPFVLHFTATHRKAAEK